MKSDQLISIMESKNKEKNMSNLKKIDINVTSDLLSSGAILYTVAWLREGEQTGSVKFCYGTNHFKDDGLPPDVLTAVQEKLNLN